MSRVLQRGSELYALAVRPFDEALGPRVPLHDHDSARSFLAALSTDPANMAVMRRAVMDARLGDPSTPAADAEVLKRLGKGIAARLVDVFKATPPRDADFKITVTGKLTLGEASWGETSGIYPSSSDLYKPDKWDHEKTLQLLRARAAVEDVATRNSDVRKSSNVKGAIAKILKPYHCIENFPPLDPEITKDVRWFYLSSASDGPKRHPGTTGTVIAKSYGDFYNIGGGDVAKGTVYIHFYKLGS